MLTVRRQVYSHTGILCGHENKWITATPTTWMNLAKLISAVKIKFTLAGSRGVSLSSDRKEWGSPRCWSCSASRSGCTLHRSVPAVKMYWAIHLQSVFLCMYISMKFTPKTWVKKSRFGDSWFTSVRNQHFWFYRQRDFQLQKRFIQTKPKMQFMG